MILQDAETLALNLMREHRLLTMGWKFKFDRAVRRAGRCSFTRKIISLSAPKVLINEEHLIKNTILHEIAHALVGSGHGHDHVWKAKAKEIGCTGERCSSGYTRIQGKYIGTCPSGHIHHKHRKSKIEQSCGICSRIFSRDYLITYTLNETIS